MIFGVLYFFFFFFAENGLTYLLPRTETTPQRYLWLERNVCNTNLFGFTFFSFPVLSIIPYLALHTPVSYDYRTLQVSFSFTPTVNIFINFVPLLLETLFLIRCFLRIDTINKVFGS